MKKLSLIIAAVLVFGVSNVVKAEGGDTQTASHTVGINVSSFALLDIETSGDMNFNLNPVAPTEAGDAISFTGVTNSDHWLNYSSIVSSEKTRSISAKIDAVLPDRNLIAIKSSHSSHRKRNFRFKSNNNAQYTYFNRNWNYSNRRRWKLLHRRWSIKRKPVDL